MPSPRGADDCLARTEMCDRPTLALLGDISPLASTVMHASPPDETRSDIAARVVLRAVHEEHAFAMAREKLGGVDSSQYADCRVRVRHRSNCLQACSC